jgi:hypothetical protein
MCPDTHLRVWPTDVTKRCLLETPSSCLTLALRGATFLAETRAIYTAQFDAF